jgi:hypothetical protein
MADPVASVTVPVMVANVVCAAAGRQPNAMESTTAKCFIEDSLSGPAKPFD